MGKRTDIKRVVVALRMAGIAGQDKLNGIFQYLSEGHRWTLAIYRTLHEFTPAAVRDEVARGADGFILGIPGADEAMREVTASGLPAVAMNVDPSPLAHGDWTLVKSDAVAVGRAAAHTLLQQGVYKSYGFMGYRTDDDWSRERGAAFRSAIVAAGFPVGMFDAAHSGGGIEDKAEAVRWLESLPKPCGILAACDDRAFELLDICRESGIAVPGDVGIIGVNNDPVLCENAEPRLTSVQPDFTGEGRLAAEILGRMMDGVSLPGRIRRVGIRGIVQRESTSPQSETGIFVQRVLAYIRREAVRGIGVRDVARAFKVSPSLLELRFREFQRESLYGAMLRIRLDEVKRRLTETDDPIEEITYACGWENPSPPKALFKKRFGVTMREWRGGKRRK
jgi:LacI family transcriptional regulator